MTCEALGWYQWMHNNHLLTTWDEFKRSFELRFGPSAYENHQQMLFKLKQTTTVSEYHSEFERLSNRVIGLTNHSILDCFIFFLRLEIKNELAILHPTSISQAIGLAKLVESKLLASKSALPCAQRQTSIRNLPPILPNPTPQSRINLSQSPQQSLALPAPPSNNQNSPQIRLLSRTETDARRARGLCFNCDEKFHKGHRCKNKQFLLLLSPDVPPDPTFEQPSDELFLIHNTPPLIPSSFLTQPETPTIEHNTEQFHLSLQVFSGQPSPRTLRFYARIHGHYVSVLVDTGSSHNIIQPRITLFLNLPIQNPPSFYVMVGKGDLLQCVGLCANVPISMAENTFSVSLYLLPIQGADIVLGVQWLQTLGSFVSDYTIPSMQFYYNGQLITLTGMASPSLSLATFPQFNRMVQTDSIATLHTITMFPTDSPTTQTETTHKIDTIHLDLDQLLQRYSLIFFLFPIT